MVGRYIIKFCSVVLLLVLTVTIHGQIKCKIEHYSTEDGLSHNAVTGIIKSSDGFMWFGTWDGINRFNGHDFVTCKSHPGDSSGLKSNRIDIIFNRIIPTSGEKVWLITTNQGVFWVKSVAAASPGITRYSPGMPGGGNCGQMSLNFCMQTKRTCMDRNRKGAFAFGAK